VAQRIRVVLVEDNDVFRETLELLLALQPDIEVIETIESGDRAPEVCARLAPDVVLMDYRMPGLDGAQATEAVLEALPAGLRTLDVMELSLRAVRTAVLRHTLAAHPPDVLITVPRSSCRTLDFHKAEEMIALGRLLAVEALDREEDRSPIRAVRGRP